MKWAIEYASSIKKDIKSIDVLARKRIKEKLEWLASTEDPRVHSKKLVGKQYKELFRYRVGDYRIVYKLEEAKIKIIVVRIGHRKDIYEVM